MKYFRTFLLALQTEFLLRINLFGWVIVHIIPTIIMILIWFAIIGDQNKIGDFTKGDFLVYYIFTSIGWYIVGGIFGWRTGEDIKNGMINTTLLKPYNIVLGKFMEEQAWKVLSLLITIPIAAIVLYIYRDIIAINLNGFMIMLLLLSLILGAIIFALTEALVGISSFWVIEVWSVNEAKEIIQYLFGGLLVPLTLLPAPILFLANILPFKYMFFVPASILLSSTANPLFDIGIQALYILILFLIYKFFWNLGIKKYEAVGV